MIDSGQQPPPNHILIVEDSAIQAEALRRILVGAGYVVSVARDGAEGLTQTRDTLPTLVISDIMMPKMDGIEMCRRIKSEPKLWTIPVILLTSLTDTGDVLRGLESGADNFITKPYEAGYLLSHLASALSGVSTVHDDSDQQGIEIRFEDKSYVITANRRQVLNTLLTTYETAVKKNDELLTAQEAMRSLNEELEQKVRERTAALTEEIEERKRAEERLRQHAERMRAFDEISQALSQSVEGYRKALGIVARRAAEMVGEWCVITLFSDDGQWLTPVAFHHSDPTAAKRLYDLFAVRPYPVHQGLTGTVATKGASALIDDLSQEESRTAINPELLPHLDNCGVRSLLIVPLRAHGEVIGTLGLTRTTECRYTGDDQSFVQDLADRAAQAVYNTQLYEEAQRRLENLQALRTIDMAVSSSFNLNFVLNVLLGQALKQLQMDAASVLLLDKLSLTLKFAAGQGFRTSALKHTHLRIGEGHAGRAALVRTLVTVHDLSQDQEFIRSRPFMNEGFVAYFGVPLIVKGEVRGVLEIFHRSSLKPTAEWLDFLNNLAGQAAISIDNATLFADLQRSNINLKVAYDTTLEGWSRALDMRDRETEGHTERVAEMTVRLAREAGMNETEVLQLRRGALLHDIGKMAIPDAILHKPGKLTEEEWEVMRQHPVHARNLLWPIEYLRPALDIPWCHHEKWDGSGYPRGLTREHIPLAARLFAVVDVWDALRSDRPYRPGWPDDQVREYLRAESGIHFDPSVVALFLSIIREGR